MVVVAEAEVAPERAAAGSARPGRLASHLAPVLVAGEEAVPTEATRFRPATDMEVVLREALLLPLTGGKALQSLFK